MAEKPTAQSMRTFLIIWFGQLVSTVGSGLTGFALGVWIYQETGSTTLFALNLLAFALPNLLVSPIAGVLVDRWDRRLAMILSDTGAGLSTVMVALLYFTGHLEVWHVYVLTAINAAFRDPRFRPLQPDEVAQVKIEVSVLTEPIPLRYKGKEDLLSQLKPGVDGLIIKKGYHQATFLPQVWEQLPQKEAFLSQLCLKAGLDGDAWEKGDLEVSVYQVQAFEE